MANKIFLKEKTISGLLWSFSDLVLNQGIQFFIQIFLARLLLPKEFGLIGMITVFIAISNTIIESGFSNALIREEKSTQEDYSTVFYFNIIVAIMMYFVLYIASPYISRFYNEPELISILRVVSLTLIVNSFGLIQRTILTKNINFKTQTKINVAASILSGIIAIIFAYKGYGVWSLVIRTLIMQITQALLLCLSTKWWPSFIFKISSFKRLFGFGWKIMVSTVIDTLYQNIYYLIIGRFFSATQLGYYTNAQKLMDVASASITTSVQKVSYPVLSSLQNQGDILKTTYKKIIKSSVFITFPVMMGLAVIARPFVTLVFGQKWIDSIYYFQLLSFAGMIYPLHAINLNILQVKGRSDLFLKLEIIKKILAAILIVGVLIGKLGIEGLLWTAIINSYLSYFINSYFSGKIISYDTKEQIRDIIPIFLASMFMAIITYCIGGFFDNSNLLQGITQIVVGIILYIGISYIMKIDELKTIYEILVKAFKKIIKKTDDVED